MMFLRCNLRTLLISASVLLVSCEAEHQIWLQNMQGSLDYSVPTVLAKGQTVAFVAGGVSDPKQGESYVWNAPHFSPATFVGPSFVAVCPEESGDYPLSVTVKATGYRDWSISKTLSIVGNMEMEGTLDCSCSSNLIKGIPVTFLAYGITSPAEGVTYTWNAPGFEPSTFEGPKFTATPISSATQTPVILIATAKNYTTLTIEKSYAVGECLAMQGNMTFDVQPELVKGFSSTFTTGGLTALSPITYTWNMLGFNPVTSSGTTVVSQPVETGTSAKITITATADQYCPISSEQNIPVTACKEMSGTLTLFMGTPVVKNIPVEVSATGLTAGAQAVTYYWDAPGYTPATFTGPSKTIVPNSSSNESPVIVIAKSPGYCDVKEEKRPAVDGSLVMSGTLTSTAAHQVAGKPVKAAASTFTVGGNLSCGSTTMNYTWEVSPAIPGATANGDKYIVTWPSAGTYEIKLTAKANHYTDVAIYKGIQVEDCHTMIGSLNPVIDKLVTKGVPVTFTVDGMSAPDQTISYQWQGEGFSPSSHTGNSFAATYIGSSSSVAINVTAKAPYYCDTKTSEVISIKACKDMTGTLVLSTPTHIVQSAGTTFTAGGLSAGSTPVSYNWSTPGFSPTTFTGSEFTTNALSAGASTITVTARANGYCDVSTTKNILTAQCINMNGDLIVDAPGAVKGLGITFSARGVSTLNNEPITYLWTAPDFNGTASSNTFSGTCPNNTGTYPISVIAKATNYCNSTYSTNISVNGGKTMMGNLSINTSTPFVSGSSHTFTANVDDITEPSKANLSYSWSAPDCSPVSGSGNTFTITTLPSDPSKTYHVILTITANGYNPKPYDLPFMVNCTAMTGSGSFTLSPGTLVAKNQIITLNAATPSSPAAVSYAWSIPGNFSVESGAANTKTLTIKSANVTDIATISLNMSKDNYCPENYTQSVKVTDCHPMPQPSITGGPFTLNSYQKATFYAGGVETISAASYEWSIAGGFTYTDNKQSSFTAKAPETNGAVHTLNLKVTAPNYCEGTASATISINEYAKPLAGTITVDNSFDTAGYSNNIGYSIWLAKGSNITLNAVYTPHPTEDPSNPVIIFDWFDGNGNAIALGTNGTVTAPTSVAIHSQITVQARIKPDAGSDNAGISYGPKKRTYAYDVQDCKYTGNDLHIDIRHQCRTRKDQAGFSINEEAYLKDAYNNIYRIVQLPDAAATPGMQWWFAENLRSNAGNNYRTYVTTHGVYYQYDNTSNNDMNDPTRGIYCPVGWRLPTDAEWTYLKDNTTNPGYALRAKTSGGKTNVDSDINWSSDTELGTDYYGFTVHATGYYETNSSEGVGYKNTSNRAFLLSSNYLKTATFIVTDATLYINSRPSTTAYFPMRCIKD